MLEEVDRLSSLVERLLTLSRAETGQAKLSLELFGVRELAEDVVAHLDVLAEEKQQQITIEGAGTAQAWADRVLVRRALINLVDNAIKFSPLGGSIRISVGGSGEEATIDVIDSGAGITVAGRDRIFDRFFRDGNIDGSTAGVGLGLSIAKGAVEVNGGHLTLAATSAEGSTFRISLPKAARSVRQLG